MTKNKDVFERHRIMDSNSILKHQENLLKTLSKNYFMYRNNPQQDWAIREILWNCYDRWVVVDDIDDVDFVDLEGMDGEFGGPISGLHMP